MVGVGIGSGLFGESTPCGKMRQVKDRPCYAGLMVENADDFALEIHGKTVQRLV